jgi:hypothetical protein
MIDIFNDWLPYFLMLLAFIEFLVRIIPTKNNYSLTDFVKAIFRKLAELIDKFIPNKKK